MSGNPVGALYPGQLVNGLGYSAVRVGLGSGWLSNIEAGNVWRIDPKRVEATLPN